jgi:hypothetical protein
MPRIRGAAVGSELIGSSHCGGSESSTSRIKGPSQTGSPRLTASPVTTSTAHTTSQTWKSLGSQSIGFEASPGPEVE